MENDESLQFHLREQLEQEMRKRRERSADLVSIGKHRHNPALGQGASMMDRLRDHITPVIRQEAPGADQINYKAEAETASAGIMIGQSREGMPPFSPLSSPSLAWGSDTHSAREEGTTRPSGSEEGTTRPSGSEEGTTRPSGSLDGSHPSRSDVAQAYASLVGNPSSSSEDDSNVSPLHTCPLDMEFPLTQPVQYVRRSNPEHESARERLLKRAYTLWVAPFFSQLPNAFKAWWHKQEGGLLEWMTRQGTKKSPVPGNIARMNSAQLYSGYVAAYTGLALLALFLLYAWRAKASMHARELIDASKAGKGQAGTVSYIPKKKFVLDRLKRGLWRPFKGTRQGSETAE